MSKRIPISKDRVYRGGGGLYQGPVSVTKMEALTGEFGPRLKITYLKPDGEEKFDFVNESKNLQPDTDGVGFEAAPETPAGQDNHGSDMTEFIDALRDAGIPARMENTLDQKGDFTALEGHDFNLVRKNTVGKDGQVILSKVHKNNAGKGWPVQHIIFDKYLGVTGSSKKSSGGDEDESESDPEQEIIAAIQKALKASSTGKLSKVIVRAAVNRVGGREALAMIDNPKTFASLAKAGKFVAGKDGGVSRK